MGINGLLPLLKSIHKSCNLKKFDGKTLGVDAYGWLHRGTVSCAMELAMGRPTRKFVDFAMHRVRMLIHFGVTPYIIFDGDYLPSKAATESDRSKRREASRKAGLELLNAGKASQAYLEFQKAVDVTPEMARQLIDELRKSGVKYIVAPYEADAQMVYLERKGIIDGIISEDSDLLVFGAQCLLTKLDQYGNCIEINKKDFNSVKEISLTGWTEHEFRRMAILSGCDYLSSINNMGLKTAYRMVRKHKTIEKVLRMLEFDGKFFVPKGYLEAYRQAEFTFLHQRVFCPRALALVLHTEPEQQIDIDKMPYLGAWVQPAIAQGVARGDLNPMTKEPIILDKRAQMVTATSPWVSNHTQVKKSTPVNDPKKGVPIDVFFKSRRTPLAELDINCFTPSPSQQDALRRNTGPWTANAAPRPYLNRSITEPEILPASAPPRQVVRTHTRTPTISEPRPPKRVRLCEDDDSLDSPSQKAEMGRSRFFASAAADLSPTVGRIARGRKSKKNDIAIFSDEPDEDFMLNLPEADGFAKTTKKIQVFEEKGIEMEDILPSISQSQSSRRANDITTSQCSVPSLTASTSISSSAEQPSTPVGNTLPKLGEKLKERFSFSAGGVLTPKTDSRASGIDKINSMSAKPSRIPLAITSNTMSSRGTNATPKPLLTGLQRIQDSAANRRRLPMTPPMTPIITVKAKSPRRSLLSKNTVPFPEVATESKRVMAVQPALVPLPMADDTEKIALLTQNGSEDHIIHDSEEEECISPIFEDQRPRLDLHQFAYAC